MKKTLKYYLKRGNGKFINDEIYYHPRLGKVQYIGPTKTKKSLVRILGGRSKNPIVLTDENLLTLTEKHCKS